MKLDVAGGAIIVEAMIDGQAANMILDTGAQRSVISPAALARLGLAEDEWVATTMRGIGGLERRRNALPRSFTLDGIALVRPTMARDTSLTVATLPWEEIAGRRIDGLLGRDYLAAFDLALDMPARSLTLNAMRDCVDGFLPPPYAALPTQNLANTALSVQVELDGIKLRALLDTGASATLVAARGMAHLGLTPAALAQDRSVTLGGIGPQSVMARIHSFRSMRVGAEVIEQPVLQVAPIRAAPIADMLLGADWMADKRVWISFATRQVFVAPGDR